MQASTRTRRSADKAIAMHPHLLVGMWVCVSHRMASNAPRPFPRKRGTGSALKQGGGARAIGIGTGASNALQRAVGAASAQRGGGREGGVRGRGEGVGRGAGPAARVGEGELSE